MIEPVLPLQTILFQTIFLLVAIALEARVLHRRLMLTRRTSMEYATSINLLSTIIGWLVFFIAQDLLPQPLKAQLISYIFFDRLLDPQPANLTLIIAATGITMFFATFLIKLKGLELLEALLQSAKEQPLSPSPGKTNRLTLSMRLRWAAFRADPNRAAIVLLANAYSHSAIFLLLFLRFLVLNRPG